MVAHRPALLTIADRVVHLQPESSLVTLAPQQLDGTMTPPPAPSRSPRSARRWPSPGGSRAAGLVDTARCLRGGRLDRPHRHGGMADLACCQRPNEAALGFAIVLVQCFGLSRGFFRYWERLVGHQAAFRSWPTSG